MPIEKRGWKIIQIPTDVVLSDVLTDFDVRVYGYLLWRAGEKSRAWPGLPRMAKDLKRSETAVKDAMRRLQLENWIKRVRRFGHSTVTYIFERQEDCRAFIAERDAAKSAGAAELQVIRSDAQTPDRTDVRIDAQPPVDQTPRRLSNRRAGVSQNDHSLNDHSSEHDECMNGEIDIFLKALPGYNPQYATEDRRKIAGKYDLAELPYLWADACDKSTVNPIGLFLMMCDAGQHSPAYIEAKQAEREQAEREAAAQKAAAQVEQRRVLSAPIAEPIEPDPSVTAPLPGHTSMTPVMVWQAAQGELQLQMTRATYDTWVKKTALLSVNGTWKIGVPNQYSKDWWDNRLITTVKRILSGIVGQECTPEFVVIDRGEA